MASRAAFTRRNLQSICGGFIRQSLCGGGYRHRYSHVQDQEYSLWSGGVGTIININPHRHSRCFSVTSSSIRVRETELEVEDLKLGRISGAPPLSLEKDDPRKYDRFRREMPPGVYVVDAFVKESLLYDPYTVEPLNAESLNLFLPRVDTQGLHYFTAHSVKDDGTLTPLYYIYPSSPINQPSYFFTGTSCDALFHFQSRADNKEHYIWNLTTNEVDTLPNSFKYARCSHHILDHAMWVSSDRDGGDYDYKVLLLVMNRSYDDVDDAFFHMELYSRKTNRWKYLALPQDCRLPYLKGGMANGAFYFPATLSSLGLAYGYDRHHTLLSFDFASENLSSLALPSIIQLMHHEYQIVEFNGLVSLVAYSNREILPGLYTRWILEDGSWKEQTFFNTFGIHKLVWSSKNGQLLYFKSLKDELVVFDSTARKLKRLPIYCCSCPMQLHSRYANAT